MKTADRQKLCSNCEEKIPLEAISCPYCSAEQSSDSAAKTSAQDSLSSSLYSPPYSGKVRYSIGDEAKAEELAPAPKKEGYKQVKNIIKDPTPAIPKSAAAEQEDEGQNQFLPMLALSLGGVLTTLGLLQFFFSENGVLRLEWDSSYWFIYCLASAPLFFFGIKKVNQLK
jgi:hypothetical protein